MPIEVIMPKVDMDMASGKVMSWHIAEGAPVTKGEPLFDIETDKAAMEVEASHSGILHHAVPPGTDVPIGAPVAWLYALGEEVGDPPAGHVAGSETSVATVDAGETEEPEPQVAANTPVPAVAEPVAGTETLDKTRATPLARSLARQQGIDISVIPGSGPQGRVQAKDVREALVIPSSGLAARAPMGFTAETGPLAISRNKGGTGTPVVMIHGFASDAMSWAPLEAHLKNRAIIRIDLPGHGKSPKMRITDFAELVKTVRRAFDSLNLDTAHLVGHSLGGALALALADTRPKSVASLTLMAPAGLGPDINGASLEGLCTATRAASLGPWLRTLAGDETRITDGYIRIAMAARQDANLRAAQAAMADVLFPDGVQAFDLRAALQRIDMPARIIWGKQDNIIPWRHALRAPGHVALHLFEGIGHIPQFEAAQEVGKILNTSL